MHKDYIIELLNLQDKNLSLDKIELIEDTYYVSISSIDKPSCCKHCGSINFIKHAYYERTIKYQNILNYKCIIKFNQKRFLCKDCNKTFNEDISFVSKNSIIANNLKVNILLQNHKRKSFKDISLESNISDTTVINQFKEHISNYRCKLTTIICIDEFKASTIAGEYALIIGDSISGKILDILPSRKQDYIYYYFQSISLEEREKVKYVVTDLFESYRTIKDTLFRKSIHIADRFHWIKLATEAFNKTRIRLMNFYLKLGNEQFKGKYNKYTEYANVLKTYHKILLANPYKRESWFFNQVIEVKHLKQEMTLQELIDWCQNQDSDIAEAYEYLMDLYTIAQLSNYNTIVNDLLKWCEKIEKTKTKLPEFKKVTATYRSWLVPIANSFIIDLNTKKRLSNGFIEGKNNFAKVIKRVGFGYKNFDIFRAKILYIDDKERPFKF